MEVEIWKDVVGYEGLYQVSSFGRVKSLERIRTVSNYTFVGRKEMIRVISLDDHGYPIVCFHKNRKSKTLKVHKLVAEAFLTKNSPKMVVNHKDNNPQNNNLSNLEYVTSSENVHHGLLNSKTKTSKYSGVGKIERKGRKIRWRAFVQLNGKYVNIGHYDTEEEASMAYHNYNLINGITNKYARTVLSDTGGIH